MRVRHLSLLLVVCGFVTGCATFVRGPPVFWNCSSEVIAEDVKGSGYYYLDAKGKPIANGSDWKWTAIDRDFQVTLTKWDLGNDLELVANVPPRITLQFRLDAIDNPQTDSALIGRASNEQRAWIRLSRVTFGELISSGRPLFVVGIDPDGRVVRSVRLDPTALTRSEAAMRSAKRRAEAMITTFRQSCIPEYGGDPMVIT